MRLRTLGRAALLLCAPVVAACSPSPIGSTPAVVTPSPITPTSLPPAGTVAATIPLIGGVISPTRILGVYGIAADDSAVWVHNVAQGTVVRVDPTTNQVVATIHVGQGLGDVVLEAGYVWVSNHDDNTVSKIDPRTNKVVDTIALPPPTGDLGVSPGAVWVMGEEGGTVSKIDAQTDQVLSTTLAANESGWMAYAAGSLWICNLHAPTAGLTRVDPTTGQVLADIDLAPGKFYSCHGIVPAVDGVWVELSTGEQTTNLGLARIDPATNTVATAILLPQSDAIVALAADASGVWSARPGAGLVRISPATHRAVGFLSLPRIAGVAVGAGSVWALDEDGTLEHITPAS